MIRIGCFHAHYSNIEYIDKALSSFNVELVHFVDPGLDRIKQDADFSEELIQDKIKAALDWISRCHVDAILITCTFFTSNLPESLPYGIPVIKIDDPLFHKMCQLDRPTTLVFTNPDTVEGTMRQLTAYADKAGKEISVNPVLLENTFPLLMQGKKNDYIDTVARGLTHMLEENPRQLVFTAQLSMVPAAQRASKDQDFFIGNHLDSLSSYLKEVLNLTPVNASRNTR
ncbi:hypothetical protein [Paenibacillus lutrae]|uniref:Asp/Glu/hydantoin racemase n=1 Tax=Paenibacillus lutrae TaxID=2078573 RepID=A0A7X3FE47_9BACL|nr:hypothetical protein [Paenibacillus lutrae]MVO97992.1 hypothetical protein [Paenibacillus lutrae]